MAETIPIGPPAEALAYFRRKGYAFGFAWQDVWQREHVRAFTVAKAMQRDILEDIRAAVDQAIAEGRTLDQFRAELRPLLEAKGWWGRKEMTDPLTTRRRVVQLGSPRRLRTIFNVNMRSAYQAGRWERMERSRSAFPFIRYMSAGDGRVRPQHQDWHGTIKPVGDPWWDTHYPPCGWNCRCTAVPVNARMMERRGWEVTKKPAAFLPERYVNPRTGEVMAIEAGIDPGFNFNVGKAYLEDLQVRPIPSGQRVEGESAQLTDAERAEAFLAPFGLDPADREGDIFVDDAGFPMAIGPAWARGADGYSAAELAAIGRTIAEPDEIRQLWKPGRDGRELVTRRYIAGELAVDVNRAGWTVEAGADRRAGERLGRPDAEAWVTGAVAAPQPKRPPIDLGPLSPRTTARLASLGLAPRRNITRVAGLDHDLTIHISRRHGEEDPDQPQQPVGPVDIALARAILNRGDINHGTPMTTRTGVPLIVVRAAIGADRYVAVYEVRRERIVPVSIRKR